MNKCKEFQEIETMTKNEAINEVKLFFKGNKKFIEQAMMLIFSAQDFEKIRKMEFNKDNWNWEKFLSLQIDTKSSIKTLCYRKGNKKYAPTEKSRGNETSHLDEYVFYMAFNGAGIEEYTFIL